MRNRSICRALGLWCSILASGTWIFPINAMSPLLATSVSIPATQDDGDNVWTESEVASSWAIATGIPYVPSAQVLTLGPGPDGFPTPIEQVNAATGVGISIGFFVVDDAILVVDQSDSIGDVSVHGCAEVVIGRMLVTADQPRSFAGFRLTYSANSSANPNSSNSVFLPIAAFASETTANAYMTGLRDASDGVGEGGGVLACINPHWIGTDGTQCCMLKAAYEAGLRACELAYWARMVACLSVALGSTVGTWKWCADRCIPTCLVTGPAGCAACAKGCFWLGAAAGLGSLLLCELGNQLWRKSCEQEKLAGYIGARATHGCPPKPLGSNGGTKVPVLLEAETLERVGGEL